MTTTTTDKAAGLLAEIYRRQDRIQAMRPDSYFCSETWQRLDAEAQKICVAAEW